jgi:hypothetical protein
MGVFTEPLGYTGNRWQGGMNFTIGRNCDQLTDFKIVCGGYKLERYLVCR